LFAVEKLDSISVPNKAMQLSLDPATPTLPLRRVSLKCT